MGGGEHLAVDASGCTGVDGVWAAGNAADVMANLAASAASGVTAAAAITMSLLTADARDAAARRAEEPFSGRMEAEAARRVLGARAHGFPAG